MLIPLTVEDAIALCNKHKASRLVILAVDDDGNYAYATAGHPETGDERSVAEWMEFRCEELATELGEWE